MHREVTEFEGEKFCCRQKGNFFFSTFYSIHELQFLSQLSQLCVSLAVCDGVLQQTIRQIEGGSQTDVPEDHLQVADLRFGLL